MDNDLTLILAASTEMRLPAAFYLGREMSKKGLTLCYSLVIIISLSHPLCTAAITVPLILPTGRWWCRSARAQRGVPALAASIESPLMDLLSTDAIDSREASLLLSRAPSAAIVPIARLLERRG
jgi:hypothetical protein